jgi:hypothetical protein
LFLLGFALRASCANVPQPNLHKNRFLGLAIAPLRNRVSLRKLFLIPRASRNPVSFISPRRDRAFLASFTNIYATKQTSQKTRPIPSKKSPFFSRDKSQTSVLICVYLRLKFLYSGMGRVYFTCFFPQRWLAK